MPLKTSKENDGWRAYFAAFRIVFSFRLRGEVFLRKLHYLSVLLEWYCLNLLQDRITTIEFDYFCHNVTPLACFGDCVWWLFRHTYGDGPLSLHVLRLHSLPELCLAQVIGDMRRSAEYNGEPIAMRLPQEILFRHSAVLLQPVCDRQLRKACPQNLTGLLPNSFQILA